MGKAQKQQQNKSIQQIARLKKDKNFMEMIHSMQDNKMYNLKRNDKDLFFGKSMPGIHWRSIFLENPTKTT